MLRGWPVRVILLAGCAFLGVAATGCGVWNDLVCRLWPDSPVCSTRVLKVNLQVDAELEDTAGITKIVNELKRRGFMATIYVTADYANRNALLISSFYAQGFEVALHGYYTGEQLATMTYDEQKDLLTRAKQAVEGCLPCGNYKPVVGFRPQYFSQNNDTYRVLDELGLTHNSGYKARQLYTPGHELDVAPYAVDGYNFRAVPISTVVYGVDRAYLCDIAAANTMNLTGEQWGQMLSSAYQQALTNQEPLVVLLHGWYTGNTDLYDYWQPFVNFLDEIRGQADFMTTEELVDYYSN